MDDTTPTRHNAHTCVHEQDHSDALECVCGDTDVRVREPQASSLETGRPVRVRVTVTNRETGAVLFEGDTAWSFDLPPGGWSSDDIVQPTPDPLDEDDHRPRHSRGGHIYRHGQEHWHTWANSSRECRITSGHGNLALLAWSEQFGPLTFCDCDDEDDHRPRHFPDGSHIYRWGAGHWHSKSVEEHPGWCDTSLHNGDSLADWARAFGPLTFCDCGQLAENGATD